VSNRKSLRLPEAHILCPECGRRFASAADRQYHYRMLTREVTVCLEPDRTAIPMYRSRGAWRRGKAAS
jgi:hypothetical protein